MRTRNLVFSVMTLLLFTSFAYAQVSGVIVDDFGPVTGAIVTVDETGVSTETNDLGVFNINASVGDNLSVMNPNTLAEKSFPVTGLNLGELVLGDAAIGLTDVITLGYSTTTDEAFTGTADVVSSEQIEKKSVSNVLTALAGESAGVVVTTGSGQPGSSSGITIRGIGSINGTTSPLIVVDGIPYEGYMNSINPADVENTVILKDATATAIYGSRGANGVIVINTKKGRKGKSEITFDSKVGFNMSLLPRYSTIESPERYMELGWEGLKNLGALSGESDPGAFASANLFGGDFGIDPMYNMWDATGADLIDPTTGNFRSGVNRKYTPERWEDYAFGTGIRTENTIRFSGGTDKTTFYSSFSYLDEKGYSVRSDYDRLSTRLNVSHEVTPWLDANVNLSYAFSDTNSNGQSDDSGSIFWFVDNIPSIFPLFLRDGEGNKVADPIYGGFQYDYGFGEGAGRNFGANTNAVADAHYNLMNSKRHDINTSASLIFKIVEGLTLETRFGSQFISDIYNDLSNPYYGSAATSGGSIYKINNDMISYNMLEMLRYSKTFGDNHNVEILAGHENTALDDKFMLGYRSGLVIPDLPEWNNANQFGSMASYSLNYAMESYFGQVNYDFARKYFLTGTIRRDGSSRFGNEKWGNFGSVGLAWMLSREDFMANQNIFDILKLKTSYGSTGESRSVGLYPWANRFESAMDAEYGFQEVFTGNPDLSWESSNMFQAGAEMRIFDRVNIDLDYYRKNSTDLLFEVRLPTSTGVAIYNDNDGELLNSGFEFNVNADVVKNENFFLNVGFNGELLNNELLAMPIDRGTGEQKDIDVAGLYGRSVGHSLFDYYMREWAGVDSETGSALWNMYFNDINSNGVFDEGDEQIASMHEYMINNPDANIVSETTTVYTNATQKYIDKTAIPDVRGAFNLSTGYKNFELSAQFLYSFGGHAYDGAYAGLMSNTEIGGNNWHTDIEQRWQQPGDVTNVPRLSNNATGDTNFTSASTRFLTKSDYIALNNIRLGYNFPSDMISSMGLAELGMYVQGDNLWLMSERDGFNPAASYTGQSDTYRYSPLSNITFGLRVKL